MLSDKQYAALLERVNQGAVPCYTFNRQGKDYAPDGLAPADRLTNEQTSALEQYAFVHSKPSRYIAYPKGNFVTTWTGDRLGVFVATISCHKTPHSWLSDHKAYSVVLGDNGIFYSCLSFGEGLYCHLKAYSDKTQAKLRRRFAYAYSRLPTDSR